MKILLLVATGLLGIVATEPAAAQSVRPAGTVDCPPGTVNPYGNPWAFKKEFCKPRRAVRTTGARPAKTRVPSVGGALDWREGQRRY
jgi:hypothetical protein